MGAEARQRAGITDGLVRLSRRDRERRRHHRGPRPGAGRRGRWHVARPSSPSSSPLEETRVGRGKRDVRDSRCSVAPGLALGPSAAARLRGNRRSPRARRRFRSGTPWAALFVVTDALQPSAPPLAVPLTRQTPRPRLTRVLQQGLPGASLDSGKRILCAHPAAEGRRAGTSGCRVTLLSVTTRTSWPPTASLDPVYGRRSPGRRPAPVEILAPAGTPGRGRCLPTRALLAGRRRGTGGAGVAVRRSGARGRARTAPGGAAGGPGPDRPVLPRAAGPALDGPGGQSAPERCASAEAARPGPRPRLPRCSRPSPSWTPSGRRPRAACVPDLKWVNDVLVDGERSPAS